MTTVAGQEVARPPRVGSWTRRPRTAQEVQQQGFAGGGATGEVEDAGREQGAVGKGPRLAPGRLTLSPIPSTAWATAPPSRADSTSTPPSLPGDGVWMSPHRETQRRGRGPGAAPAGTGRTQARTSLGHLRPVATPVSSRTARRRDPRGHPQAGRAGAGNAGGGRRRTETAIEVRGGVSQGTPRPPPAGGLGVGDHHRPLRRPLRGEAPRDVVGGRCLLQIVEGVPQGAPARARERVAQSRAGSAGTSVAPGTSGLAGRGCHRRATTSRRVRAYHSTTLRKRSAGSAMTPGLTPLILLLTAKS